MNENPLAGLKAGPLVDRACYTDPQILELEQKRIFRSAWLFVCHATELNKPGDFRTAELAGQPVIAVKGKDQSIRVLFNSCRHRGTTVEEAPEGNRDGFRCPYHHWTYDLEGRLIDVPRVEGMGTAFRMENFGLKAIPRVAIFHGMIFGSLDPSAPEFDEYLGPAREYLEYVATYEGEEQQVAGYYEYSFDANWKLLMENTLDDYHAEYLHGAAFAQRRTIYRQAEANPQSAERTPKMLGRHGALDWNDTDVALLVQKRRRRRVYAGIFPNCLALYHPGWDVTGLRILLPERADCTRVLTYCLAPLSADKNAMRDVAERFHYSWGPGGRVGVDDLLVLRRLQKGLQAATAGDVLITRGAERSGWKGTSADETAVRGFWNGWREYMLGEPLPKA